MYNFTSSVPFAPTSSMLSLLFLLLSRGGDRERELSLPVKEANCSVPCKNSRLALKRYVLRGRDFLFVKVIPLVEFSNCLIVFVV